MTAVYVGRSFLGSGTRIAAMMQTDSRSTRSRDDDDELLSMDDRVEVDLRVGRDPMRRMEV